MVDVIGSSMSCMTWLHTFVFLLVKCFANCHVLIHRLQDAVSVFQHVLLTDITVFLRTLVLFTVCSLYCHWIQCLMPIWFRVVENKINEELHQKHFVWWWSGRQRLWFKQTNCVYENQVLLSTRDIHQCAAYSFVSAALKRALVVHAAARISLTIVIFSLYIALVHPCPTLWTEVGKQVPNPSVIFGRPVRRRPTLFL